MPGSKMPRQYKKKGVSMGPYKVVNPRKIPEGIPVVTIHEVDYYEGDIVKGVDVRDLVARGFLVPLDGGETEVSSDG
jgi:hypothetical protein